VKVTKTAKMKKALHLREMLLFSHVTTNYLCERKISFALVIGEPKQGDYLPGV
jgi:hypothetical protein